MYHIYKITNKIDNKFYIGYTSRKNPMLRWSIHKAYAKKPYNNHGNGYLYNAMRKHGIENFSFEILAWGEDEDAGLRVAEPLFIEIFNPHYNMTVGGEGMLGYKHTIQALLKISGENHYCFGKSLSQETRERISESKCGISWGKHTLETRRKISETKRAKNGTN